MQNLAVVYYDSNAYRLNFTFMELNEATYLLNNSNENSKREHCEVYVCKSCWFLCFCLI